MTKIEYLKSLDAAIANAETTEATKELKIKKAFAVKYFNSNVDAFRDSLISQYIEEKHNKDAQIAILFNKETEPTEYANYQTFRAQCKAKADSKIAEMKAEVDKAIA